MADGKINEQILKSIRANGKQEPAIAEFLVELILEEAEHPGQWRWKDAYRKKMQLHCEKWETGDEN